MGLIRNQVTGIHADGALPSRSSVAPEAGLDHTDAAVRRAAVRDLAQQPESATALAEHLQHENDPSVRETILDGLTHLFDHQAVTALVECLRSEDAALRNEAVEAMKLLPAAAAAPLVQGLLVDDDADVRILALNVLESLRHPQVETWLIQVIDTDPHINVCATAVDLLSEIGTAAAVQPLERVKARFADTPYLQFAADLALKRVRQD